MRHKATPRRTASGAGRCAGGFQVLIRCQSVTAARIRRRPSGDYSVNLIDGIRVSFPDGWALARASNTQPVLVLRFESISEAGLARIRKSFEDVVQPLL